MSTNKTVKKDKKNSLFIYLDASLKNYVFKAAKAHKMSQTGYMRTLIGYAKDKNLVVSKTV